MAVAISCKNVSKAFQLYEHRNDQLKQILFGHRKKFYFEKWALKNVSFEVKKGKCFGIVGPNGAGKTTLLQILCGITTPTTGEVYVEGRIAPILALGVAFDPLLTGRQNVELGAAILGLSMKEAYARTGLIADFADIGPAFDYQLRTYSSGMVARLAFAICAHVSADIFIIDEALSVGDLSFLEKCNRVINNFSKSGTIILVSHSMEYVSLMCDEVMWVDEGVVREIGTAKDVVRSYMRHISRSVDKARE